MTATNTAILDELEGAEQSTAAKHAAERDKALATYWTILSDPTRTSAADKAAMAAAMKTLGKTIVQADADAKVIEAIRAQPEIEARATEASSAFFAAGRDLDEKRKNRPAEILKCNKVVTDQMAVVNDRERVRNGSAKAAADARAFLAASAGIAQEAKRFVKL